MQRRILYYSTIHALKTMPPETVALFAIYPATYPEILDSPALEISIPDSMINEFFLAVDDARSYWLSPGSISSLSHVWFMEIMTEDRKIQISCYIPSQKRHTVLCDLGKFSATHASYYGEFQSQQLFQWYQIYSHRWLESENSPPQSTSQ